VGVPFLTQRAFLTRLSINAKDEFYSWMSLSLEGFFHFGKEEAPVKQGITTAAYIS
jgi:hypothetical protein